MQNRVERQVSMEIQRMLARELGEQGISVFRKECADMGIKPEELQLKDLLNLSQRIIRALRPKLGNDEAQRIGKEIQKFKILSELEDIRRAGRDPASEHRELEAYCKLGNISYTIGDWDDALDYYGRVKVLAQKLNDRARLAEAHRNVGHIYKRQSRWEDAIKAFEAGIKALEGTDSAAGMSDAHRGMGYVHWRMGDYARAKECFEVAMRFAEQSGDKVMIGLVHIEWGLTYSDLGEMDRAKDHYERSITILEDAKEYQQLSRAYNNLGDIFLQRGDYEGAIRHFELCRAAAEKMNHLTMIGWSLFNTAEALSMSGKPDQAIPLCERAVAILEGLKDHVGVSAAHRNLGLAYGLKREWRQAEQHFREAEIRLVQINSPFNTAHLHLEWGLMLRAKGDRKEAKAHLAKASEIFESLGAPNYLERTRKGLEGL